ncbi:hypothetical protein MKK70_13300 [Methylobacterium sp. E-041]|jgi:hypothetical protein|uniref:hypothetical protein n=1 Tax=unclassified Methylobacterium TaxID=2615210 RepID=UPI0011C71C6E|nr:MULTISPECIES: hypothetical protein [unclassified Methylobacterium]TXM89852.1 hypothetical protein FV219_22785 [Methylobacterium sp. WL122]MCJ2008183.1 hypothetical protein [Methylobacterium sp. J-092]MCJ2038162.1 hypothetical protein [Methylobacterium sp. J-059]MCJ2078430.1 hypothetical protein [Methylobacterium sp. E-016]MCJ2106340.1 hypothetical protein [Methylobacterium sp. E-041]
MTQAHPTSGAEPDAACPVSLELLGEVYRADEYDFPEIVAGIAPLKRAQLAAYLYGKSHMHQLGLKVARACEREDLIRVAGEVGSVIHGQAHLKPAPAPVPVVEAGAPKPKKVSLGGPAKKISLGGSAAKGRSFD